MRFQLFSARLALAALVLAALIAAAAIAGVRLGGMAFSAGLKLMAPAVGLGLIALAAALVWLFSALKNNEGTGRRLGLIALVGSVALLWPPLSSLVHGSNAPPIHDATTDPEDPPQFVFLAKARKPGMNSPVFDGTRQIRFQGDSGSVAYILHLHYGPLTKPLRTFAMPKKAFWRCFETVKRLGWTIVAYSEKEGRIEATAPSFWFGQVSDVAIRVEPAGTLGSRVDARAESESGDTDFGRNIALLQDFFRELNR